MKTLDKLTKERLHKENKRISHILALYNDRGIDSLTKDELRKRLKYCRKAIGNLDETVKIEIAKHINSIFIGLSDSLEFDEYKILFETDIDAYLYKMASLVVEDDKFVAEKESGFSIDFQRAVLFFDFTKEELVQILSMTRDEMMTFINNKYNTNIPMIKELIDARNEWAIAERFSIERIEKSRDLKILGIRNGAYIKNEYPLFYEKETIENYDKTISEKKNTLKRK